MQEPKCNNPDFPEAMKFPNLSLSELKTYKNRETYKHIDLLRRMPLERIKKQLLGYLLKGSSTFPETPFMSDPGNDSLALEFIKIKTFGFSKSLQFHVLLDFRSDHMYGAYGIYRFLNCRQTWTPDPLRPQNILFP